MIFYDHGMLGATVAVAVGVPRRHGWAAVFLAALASMFPDWDAMAIHISLRTYEIGHRVWGHNLFAVTLAGVCIGGLGHVIHRSGTESSPDQTMEAGPWFLLGLLLLWSHPFFDMLYCSWDRQTDWPVGLFWPVASIGFGVPCIRWTDWGATVILSSGLLCVAAMRQSAQRWACLTLVVLTGYIVCGGILLHWD